MTLSSSGCPLVLVEEVIVHFDFGVGFEIIRHQHYRDLDVTEVIYLETQTEETRTRASDTQIVIAFTQQARGTFIEPLSSRQLSGAAPDNPIGLTSNSLRTVVHWWLTAKTPPCSSTLTHCCSHASIFFTFLQFKGLCGDDS